MIACSLNLIKIALDDRTSECKVSNYLNSMKPSNPCYAQVESYFVWSPLAIINPNVDETFVAQIQTELQNSTK